MVNCSQYQNNLKIYGDKQYKAPNRNERKEAGEHVNPIFGSRTVTTSQEKINELSSRSTAASISYELEC